MPHPPSQNSCSISPSQEKSNSTPREVLSAGDCSSLALRLTSEGRTSSFWQETDRNRAHKRRAAFSTRDTENRPKICLDKSKSSHEETEGAEFAPPNLLKYVNIMLAPCMPCVCPMYVCVWLFGTKIQNPLLPRKHSAVFIFTTLRQQKRKRQNTSQRPPFPSKSQQNWGKKSTRSVWIGECGQMAKIVPDSV